MNAGWILNITHLHRLKARLYRFNYFSTSCEVGFRVGISCNCCRYDSVPNVGWSGRYSTTSTISPHHIVQLTESAENEESYSEEAQGPIPAVFCLQSIPTDHPLTRVNLQTIAGARFQCPRRTTTTLHLQVIQLLERNRL